MKAQSEEQAAKAIQRAVRNRQHRKNPGVLLEMRQAELEIQKQHHRRRLEKKEREYLFLAKLPAHAVLRMTLRKQEDAAVALQAFWRGKKARQRVTQLKQATVPTPSIAAAKKYNPPPDNFYRPLDPARHEAILKTLRTRGAGDLEEYKFEYSRFLDKQVNWETMRKTAYSNRNEAKTIMKTLQSAKSLEEPLRYTIGDASAQERAKAKLIHRRKLQDPAKWWKNLEDDDEWEMEVIGANVVAQVQAWKELEFYKSRRLEFAGR